MDIAVLDLEWNAAYTWKWKGYINEIIEFGAVRRQNVRTPQDICPGSLPPEDAFSCFVRPKVGKRLNSVTASLTNLTEEDLAGGMSYMSAVRQFRQWLGGAVLMTWGSSDILTLIENCRYYTGQARVPFLTSYCDLQRYAEERLGLDTAKQLGLEKAAELLGIDVSQMEQHRALDDSLVTLRILEKIFDPKAIQPFIQACDEEFYRKMTFRTSYVRELDDLRVKPEYLRFSCPHCGGDCGQDGQWLPRNRGFQTEFQCKDCGYRFVGRVMIKEKYEGVMVTKKTFIVPVVEPPREALPGPVGHMDLEVKDGVGLLRFPQWRTLKGVRHAFSTRLGGVSGQEFAAMNLGFGRGDSDENVTENYRRFCSAAGFDPEALVCGAQVHKTDVLRVDRSHGGQGIWNRSDTPSADGLCTNVPGTVLVVFAADCVPVYFYDPEHHAIGLAHAGWRGAAAGMPAVMVERMGEEFGSNPQRLLAAIGPSICKDCFEVDEPVAKEFLSLPGAEDFVAGPEHEKYHVDLWECCRQSLLRAGVPQESITLGGVCTMEESTLLFSHRKTRGRRGSNCAMLALEP